MTASTNLIYLSIPLTIFQQNDPFVVVDYDYKKLEPIGMVFVVFFAIVLTIQVIGMLIHRWGTISHIISTTKMPLFTNALQVHVIKLSIQCNGRKKIG